ncbi:DUF4236 domain-containing protein [Actinomadura logoneensis]|uniref:DUF4236 domain-containing protein n=1 Tax=Actinomadura logoneensis TaxID=2293572 RepID=A0A372JHD9_9ACTN|nr:DUF4236 domain-containing protein [Actinomadura logoneensis]RFU39435.1 DUF4236 domain-containing protein [Actinomadura logoneensis]
MGFYVRTSLKAGPFRFNLSPSGIGVSAGVPGFRVGTGPRGNYVRIGAAGVYYRTTFAGSPGAPRPRPAPMPRVSDVVLADITGASVQELVAAHPSDLVSQLQKASRRVAVWPFVLTVLVLVSLLLGAWGLLTLVLGIPAVVWLSMRDRARRSVVVMYDVNDAPAQRFGMVVETMTALAESHGLWLLPAAGHLHTTHQRKVNAGASTLVERSSAKLTIKGPRELVTNIAVPTLTSGKRSVSFLPDRVLVKDGRDYADLPYRALRVTGSHSRMVESGSPPADGTIVAYTWRFVNVNGTPDRRFNNNRQLPVLLYGRLTLSSATGLHLVWEASRAPAVDRAATALRGLAAVPQRVLT